MPRGYGSRSGLRTTRRGSRKMLLPEDYASFGSPAGVPWLLPGAPGISGVHVFAAPGARMSGPFQVVTRTPAGRRLTSERNHQGMRQPSAISGSPMVSDGAGGFQTLDTLTSGLEWIVGWAERLAPVVPGLRVPGAIAKLVLEPLVRAREGRERNLGYQTGSAQTISHVRESGQAGGFI